VPGSADDPPGISVVGTGYVSVIPDQLEITVSPGGTAELSSDALVKHRDAVRRVTESFEGLKMDQLAIQPESLTVQQAGGPVNALVARMGNEDGNTGKSEVHIARSIKLVLSGIDKMDEEQLTDAISRLLDTARDAGVTAMPGESKSQLMMSMMGRQLPANFVTFVVSDVDRPREQAYRRAFGQARSRAERLAMLANVKLGEVLSVEETPVSSRDDNQSMQEAWISAMYGLMEDRPDEHRVTSHELGELPIVVRLKVRFALQN
jgi:uncharacterized protein YggE